MKKKMLTISCCLLGFGTTTLFAQQGPVAAGGNATGTGGTVSYSIGQVFYSTPSGSTHNLIQGVQLPYEIYVVTSVEEEDETIGLTVSVYPNPVMDQFNLRVENSSEKDYTYRFFNAQGQVICDGKVEHDETTISTASLATSFYILNVYSKKQTVKSFKIIKHE